MVPSHSGEDRPPADLLLGNRNLKRKSLCFWALRWVHSPSTSTRRRDINRTVCGSSRISSSNVLNQKLCDLRGRALTDEATNMSPIEVIETCGTCWGLYWNGIDPLVGRLVHSINQKTRRALGFLTSARPTAGNQKNQAHNGLQHDGDALDTVVSLAG